MRIVICGGGSLGHACAGILSNISGVTVDLLTNRPEQWNRQFKVNLPHGSTLTGELGRITNNPADVIPNADWVFLCLPAFRVEAEIIKIKTFLSKDTILGAVFGCTGFFLYAHEHLPSSTKLFAFQRVPYISRVVEYGKEVNLLGYRDKLIMAVENIEHKDLFRKQIEEYFSEATELADSFYEVTLSNSNPILHTGRLYSMWKDWDGKPFDRCSLFYKEWTLQTSQLEVEMDREFFNLLHKLNVSTAHISTLLEHYESTDAEGMTFKIRSIESLSTIFSPMKQVEQGWIPDFESRYFTEDFPFGLKTIYNLAKEHDVDCPNIEMVLKWGLSKITQ